MLAKSLSVILCGPVAECSGDGPTYVERRGVEGERREGEEGWRAETNEKVHL